MLKYEDIKKQVELPVKQRGSIEIYKSNGLYKSQKIRKYHLNDKELKELLEKSKIKGEYPNPYKRQGIYKAIIQSLINLGINRWHSFKNIRDEIEKVMRGYKNINNKNFWEAFSNKIPRNPFSGKDLTGRIIQNAEILQRVEGLNCYGIKLKQLGISIHIKKENSIIYFKLDTTTEIPYNNLK